MNEVYTIDQCYVYGIRKAQIISKLSDSYLLVKDIDNNERKIYKGLCYDTYDEAKQCAEELKELQIKYWENMIRTWREWEIK